MVIFEQELNWDLQEYNFLEDLKDINLLGGKYFVNLNIENDKKSVFISLLAPIRGIERSITLELIFNNIEVQLVRITSVEEDENFNKYDLQNFYFEYIQNELFNLRAKKKTKFTIRNYRTLLNSSNINSIYKVNGGKKFIFGPLHENYLEEPLTEQIIYFDIEVEANSVITARSIAHNEVSDYASYLAVILDVGIDDVRSEYLTFVEKSSGGDISSKRRRTGFIDDYFKFVVKDNLNGLRTLKDVNDNKLSGYYNISALSSAGPLSVVSGYIGDENLVNQQFIKHRLMKPPKNNRPEEHVEKDLKQMHLAGNSINIPSCIGEYFKGIENLKDIHFRKYELFRNACRLYNLGCIFHKYSPTAHIAYLTSAVETLAKTENNKFTPFIRDNVDEFNNDLLNFIYGNVRSGHYHSGEFPFMEYKINLNNAIQTEFFIAQSDFFEARQLLRSAFINWIEKNIIKSS
ncbi:hypothetical protein [Lysinibacillus piscis]|uniref:ApeA N-terminal domain-containing protein n=1 Tax=Lysinibacillus piscis TaxID=2518931 RepID=A0ABQ5NNP0_9BACI|nr:hypothetical protein [Lysinibacillus sp. KH24]GLC89706.1 hypothetical protein LYSBPC_28330 [Lysinibacillus sp. KH24]